MALYRLTADEVIKIHDHIIRTYGGVYGVLNPNGLESALARPFSGYLETLQAQAAAMMHALIKNHPFTEGNKRTATAATMHALAMTGVFVVGNRKFLKIDKWAEAIADDKATQAELQTYFRRHIRMARGRERP